MANQLEWERVQEVYSGQPTPTCSTYRAKVPGGWLVAVWSAQTAATANHDSTKHIYGGGVAFVPDATHAWALDKHTKP